MSVKIIQVTANATTPVFLGAIPNGTCSVSITNDVNTSILVGVGTNLTTTNGYAIPANGTISFQTYPSSRGTSVYALVATTGTTGPVSMLISTTD